MKAVAKATIPPVLEEQYLIPLKAGAVSIDDQVESILARTTQSPVLRTGKALEIGAMLPARPPETGVPLQTAVDEIMQSAGAFYRKNAHPGMFSYVASSGLPTDPLGHALTAALNQNLTGYEGAPGATMVERTIVGWMCRLAGLPSGSDGLVVSGGSLANMSAIAVAIYHSLGPAARERGIQGSARLVILAARSAHFSIERAAVMLGLGKEGVEYVDLDNDRRLDARALESRLEEISGDPQRKVCCVIATAGTTAMGVVDPLSRVAEICRRYGTWLHVDAAYGGAALLSDGLRDRLKGIEQADSIAIDLHKWCYLAFDGSMLLYRRPELARELYAFEADYARHGHGQEPEEHKFFDLSPEVSRRSRALPTYLAWRHYGLDRLGRNIQHNADCARYLANLIEAAADMQLVGQPELSICCFRHVPPSLQGQDEKIDMLNTRIVELLAEEGNFLLSPTFVDGRPVLRVCICSHATRAQHMEELVVAVRRTGGSLGDAHRHHGG